MTCCSHCSGSLNSNQLPPLDFYTPFPKNVRQLVRQALSPARLPEIRAKLQNAFTQAPMAKGYWNVSGAITNPEGMGPYLQAVEPYLAKFNARFLCRDLKTDVREGGAGHLTVIIEFESLAEAKASYDAPEYQEMLKLRQPHSNVSLSIIEEGDHAGH